MEDEGMPQKKHKPEEIVAKLRQVVNGGVKSGHAAAQDQASGGTPSAMARALPG